MKIRRENISSRGETAKPSAAHKTCLHGGLTVVVIRVGKPAEDESDHDEQHAADRNRDPLHRHRHAEQLVEAGDDPVAEDRLVDARLVVEGRKDVVAALDHLARRLDVERFVGVPDGRATEIHEKQHEGGCQKRRLNGKRKRKMEKDLHASTCVSA